MPEFILNVDGAGPDWHALDSFTQGFIEALFFCECSAFDSSEFFQPDAQEDVQEGRADGSVPSDAGPADLDPAALADIVGLCSRFQSEHAALLELAYSRDYDSTQAGRDLYYTRAGHGVGYWDRAALELESPEYESLTRIMVDNRDKPAVWDAACAARRELSESSIGNRLSAAAGRGEISAHAYESSDAPNGYRVGLYLA